MAVPTGSDRHVFMIIFVSLLLVVRSGDRERVLWENPAPSGPKSCGPIHFRRVQQSAPEIIEEIGCIREQIRHLEVTVVPSSHGGLMLLTMVDSKVCNALTGTSSSLRCYTCEATSEDFNDAQKNCSRGEP